MTKEEAKAEINKVFEPAFANYIITALVEGATPSERKTGKWIDDGQYADYHSEHGFHCSVCGGCIIDYVCQVYDENPHCKWCGAKMEGTKEV